MTCEVRQFLGKPHLVVDLHAVTDPAILADWIQASAVAVLNVAGPRESGAPGVRGKAAAFLRDVFGLLDRQ